MKKKIKQQFLYSELKINLKKSKELKLEAFSKKKSMPNNEMIKCLPLNVACLLQMVQLVPLEKKKKLDNFISKTLKPLRCL